MSGEEVKAAMRRGPESGNGIQIAVTTTSTATALPAHFLECWVQVKCTAGDCRILFGTATTVVDATATSGATFGYPIGAGEKEDWELKRGQTHIICDAAVSATIEVWINSGKGY